MWQSLQVQTEVDKILILFLKMFKVAKFLMCLSANMQILDARESRDLMSFFGYEIYFEIFFSLEIIVFYCFEFSLCNGWRKLVHTYKDFGC